MSDDPVLAALARLKAGQSEMSGRLSRLETGQSDITNRLERVESEQTRLREQVNIELDDILDKMSAMRTDTDTTRGYALYAMQDGLTLSQRITKIEEEPRRGK